MPAGALRGAVQPAEGPARAVSCAVWGAPAGPLRHLPQPGRARPCCPLPHRAPGPGNFARVGGRERLSLAPLLAREGPRRDSGRRLAVLGAGAGGERRAVGSGLCRARAAGQGCAGPGPARAAPAAGRGAGMAGTGSWVGQGSSRHVWSVRGRAAPLCKSALQHRMIVTHRVSSGGFTV